jgi:DMATS type aromatic prenyltransferase
MLDHSPIATSSVIEAPSFLDVSHYARTGRSGESYAQVMARGLRAMCDAAGFTHERREAAVALIRDLLEPWGQLPIGRGPTGASDITDEHFPIEFSLALEDGVPEVRVLFEAQPEVFRQTDLWLAAWDVCEKLEREHGVSLARLRQVADLYEPTSPTCRYALWHGVSFTAAGAPKFKVYLNPLAQGPRRGPAVICETLTRLGFTSALQDVFVDCEGGCEFRFISLDLGDCESARVKIYRVHHNATRPEIESWLRVIPGCSPDLVDQFWATIAGGGERFTGLPVSTYLSLDSRNSRPSTATIHFPVRSYATDDLEVHERLKAFLTGDDRAIYERVIAAIATRPLEAGLGLHSYVALRLHHGSRHVTVYLSPEAYRTDAPRESRTHNLS